MRWMQPVHGYDVRRELLSWGADKWANVQPGSIYHALRKLTEEGLLRAVATEQVGARPARTTYEVTSVGRTSSRRCCAASGGACPSRWTRSPRRSASCRRCPAPRRRRRRNRANLLRASVASMRSSSESDWIRNSKPVHVGWMFELWSARAEAELSWCEQIAERIESGVSYLPAELENAEGWSAYREGGLPPAANAE
ncbi:PadR family transcriptional regulator [Micromonospora sp. M12]